MKNYQSPCGARDQEVNMNKKFKTEESAYQKRCREEY